MLFCNQIKYIQKLLPQNILAMLCGCLLTLSFAPFNFWPTMFVAIGFVFYLLQNIINKKQAFWLGFCFSFAFNFFGRNKKRKNVF
jgi:apolipoprotein N-acyltransferase